MPSTKYPLIAREGWLFILLAVLGVVVMFQYAGWMAAAVPLIIGLFLFLLFRAPYREVPSEPLGVLSPVDGRVTDIQPTDRGLLHREAVKITIRIDHLGAYTTRSPVEGKVLYLNANVSDGSRLLGIAGLWIHTDEDDDVVVLMRGARWIGRPVAFLRYGERVGQGQRFGYVRLATHADVYVPGNCRINPGVGDKVFAGASALAHFVHR